MPLSATAESCIKVREWAETTWTVFSELSPCSLHIRSLESRWYWRQNLSCLSLHPQHPALDHAEQMLRDALLSEQMNQQHFHFSTSFPHSSLALYIPATQDSFHFTLSLTLCLHIPFSDYTSYTSIFKSLLTLPHFPGNFPNCLDQFPPVDNPTAPCTFHLSVLITPECHTCPSAVFSTIK